MRLIDTSSFELLDFRPPNIPPYAILSHTWGKDEFIFTDRDEPHRRDSTGFKKISACCALAVSEGWGYLWVDTCCIDKSSSAELTESINSMYKWYQESETCYAYIADFSLKSRHAKNFKNSRWFTRGWTLQELLAPKSVVFYDWNWIEIGTKDFLQSSISQVCRISPDHMKCPGTASNATKMSWASKRYTSREEDMAYCLLGIFGIYMSLIYGEGRNAFFRLQSEIIRFSSDESIFAWSDQHLLSSGLLALGPGAFSESHDIVPIGMKILHRPPYYMTNKGLAMEFDLRPKRFPAKAKAKANGHGWCTPLACAKASRKEKPFMLDLISEGETASRVNSNRLDFFDAFESFFEPENPEERPQNLTFYVTNENEPYFSRVQRGLILPTRVHLSSGAKNDFKLAKDQSLGGLESLNDGPITSSRNVFLPSQVILKFTSERGYDFVLAWTEQLYEDPVPISLWISQQRLDSHIISDPPDCIIHVCPQSSPSERMLLKPSAMLGPTDNAISPIDKHEFLWLKTRWEVVDRPPREVQGKDMRVVVNVDVTTVDRTKV